MRSEVNSRISTLVTTGARNRIPSLDGLRAVSILMVLIGHQAQYFSGKIASFLGSLGWLGVQVFFVISGYLITTLLLNEKIVTGNISLRDFYARRCLRILPAFYAFVLVIIMLKVGNLIYLPPSNLWYVLTYTVNYTPHGVWWTGHLWSLSVEEQFYLIWPLMMRFCTLRTNLIAACALIGIAPVLRYTLAVTHDWHNVLHAFFPPAGFPVVADTIACGCLLAMVLPKVNRQKWFVTILKSQIVLLLPPAVVILRFLSIAPRWFPPTLYLLVGGTAINVGITLCVARFTHFSTGLAGVLLNWKFITTLGALSYSLYLWQQLFMNPYAHSFAQRAPLNIVLAFGAACLSFYCFERPLIRLRKRFSYASRPRTSSEAVIEKESPIWTGMVTDAVQ